MGGMRRKRGCRLVIGAACSWRRHLQHASVSMLARGSARQATASRSRHAASEDRAAVVSASRCCTAIHLAAARRKDTLAPPVGSGCMNESCMVMWVRVGRGEIGVAD